MKTRLAYYKSTVLSPREEQVYDLLLKGKKRNDIAMALGIAPSTACCHIVTIYQKKFVNGQRELMQQRIEELEEVINELRKPTDRARKTNDPVLDRYV